MQDLQPIFCVIAVLRAVRRVLTVLLDTTKTQVELFPANLVTRALIKMSMAPRVAYCVRRVVLRVRKGPLSVHHVPKDRKPGDNKIHQPFCISADFT